MPKTAFFRFSLFEKLNAESLRQEKGLPLRRPAEVERRWFLPLARKRHDDVRVGVVERREVAFVEVDVFRRVDGLPSVVAWRPQ